MLIVQLVIIQAITFIALVFSLRKIMYSTSFAEVKRLQQLTQESAKKSQELAEKIEEAERHYREKTENAEAEAKNIKAQAEKEAGKIKEEIVNKARQESDHIVNRALNSKERVREEIRQEVRDECIKLFSRIISEILGSKNQKLLQEGLISDIVQEIEKTDSAKLTTASDKGELLTAQRIDKDRKEQIERILVKKIGKEISLEEKLDENIIAGIVIKLGSLLIDGSLSGKLKEAAEALKKG